MKNYPSEFPRLPIEAILFFTERPEGEKWQPKTIFEFCSHYKRKFQTDRLPQPRVVAGVCERLVEAGKLSVHSRSGIDSVDNRYFGFLKDESVRTDEYVLEFLNLHLGFIVYGFPYIYQHYRTLVLPLLFVDGRCTESLGTCFRYRDAIVSAKHCFESARKVAIRGFNGDALKNASYWVHENDLMDLIYVQVPGLELLPSFSGQAEVLDEIMTLGYPKIPGYHNFLAAETATLSSRLTATVGSVAARAKDIWIRENLMLITARIQGGNSGGPVVNTQGQIVGISVNMAQGEGEYDDLGYGTAIPISFIDDDIANSNACKPFDAAGIEFIDFDES